MWSGSQMGCAGAGPAVTIAGNVVIGRAVVPAAKGGVSHVRACCAAAAACPLPAPGLTRRHTRQRGRGANRSRRPHRAHARRFIRTMPPGKGKRRFDDDAETFAPRGHRQHLEVVEDNPDEGTRWSTWDQSTPTEKGPRPYPRLARHRAGRGRHRTRHAQDRQGGRRLPDRARACPAPTGAASWPPSGTGPPSTACSTATPATSRGAGSGSPGPTGPWRPGPRSARRSSPGSGRPPSSARCAGCYELGVPVPYPVQILGTEMLLEFIGSPTAPRPRPGWPSCARTPPTCPTCGGSWSRRCTDGPGRVRPRRPVGVQPAGPRGTAGRHRPAADRGRGGQPAGQGVPGPGRATTSPPGSPPTAWPRPTATALAALLAADARLR